MGSVVWCMDLVALWHVGSSWIRYRTHVPCIGRQILNHWTTRKVPRGFFWGGYWTVVLEKNVENPLDSQEIKPVNPKGNQPWLSIGRTGAEAEAPLLWPPNGTSQLIGKDPDAGKDWRQEKKEMTEDEMVGWHHWCNGHEFEQTPGDCEETVHSIAKSWMWLSNWTITNFVGKTHTLIFHLKWDEATGQI